MNRKIKNSKKLLTSLLAVAMVIQLIAPSSYAKAASNMQSTKTITAFAKISDEIKQQQVSQGETQSRITLPETLSVTVKDVATDVSKEEVVEDVTWKLDTEKSASDTFDTRKAMNGDNYTYVAVLPKGYDLASGVELPCINVRIKSVIQRKGSVKAVTRESSDSQSFAGGTGTLEDPYQIATADQLYYFASLVNSGKDSICASLTTDITLNEGTFTIDVNNDPLLDGKPVDVNKIRNWTPIASAESYLPVSSGYKGTFSGNDHTISGLYINKKSIKIEDETSGLFGKVGNGTVKDINVVNSYMKLQAYQDSYSKIGGIAGYGYEALIENCNFKGFVIGNGYGADTGGIIGYGGNTTIKNCTNAGFIYSYSDIRYVGGIIGESNSVNIIGCQNTGEIKFDSSFVRDSEYVILGVGGLCGWSYNTSIEKSWNTGSVTGTGKKVAVGGLVGYLMNSTNVSGKYISDCYNVGKLKIDLKNKFIDGSIGGIIGRLGNTYTKSQIDIKNCYSLGDIVVVSEVENGSTAAGSIIGSIGNKADIATLKNSYYDVIPFPYCAIGNTLGTITGEAIVKKLNQFRNGEVAYLLNGATSRGKLTWGQNIDRASPFDKEPVLSKDVVYYVRGEKGYSNTDSRVLKNIKLTTDSVKKVYFEKEKFDTTGMIVTAEYEKDITEEISEYTIDKSVLAKGDTEITVTYKHGDQTKVATIPIEVVNDSDLSAIEIVKEPTKTAYQEGENFDKTGMIVKAVYGDNVYEKVIDDFTIDITGSLTAKDTKITISYKDFTATQPIKVSWSNWIDKADTSWFKEDIKNYTFTTAEELAGLARLSKTRRDRFKGFTFTLGKNIDLGKSYWTPIGSSASEYRFEGTFDGAGHTIHNLTIDNIAPYVSAQEQGGSHQGLFSYISTGSSVKNVNLKNVDIKGFRYVGGIAGENYGKTGAIIENCTVSGSITAVLAEKTIVGGIVGMASSPVINSYNTASVTGGTYVGGISGWGYAPGKIENCYNAGTVIGTGTENVGAILGCIDSYQLIEVVNSYYLKGCISVSGVVKDIGVGFGTDTTIAKTAKEFATGEVTYLLNGSNEVSSRIWYQTLGEEGDAFPVLDATHKPVYKIEEEDVLFYANSNDCIMSASSKTKDGQSTNITLSGLGTYQLGKKITLEAPISSGYNFIGWYLSSTDTPYYTGKVLEKNRVYTFTATEDKDLVAVYEGNGESKVTIDASGKNYTINEVVHTDKDTSPYAIGQSITVAVKDTTNFLYWQNDYGMIVSRNASYTFTVTDKASLTAIYDVPRDDEAMVIYESHYGQVISRERIKKDDPVTLPQGPARYGYTFEKWSLTEPEIKQRIIKGEKIIRVTPAYILESGRFKILVGDGYFSNGLFQGYYNMNEVVKIFPKTYSKDKFSHWKDSDGNILSYQREYQFYAVKDMDIYAVFVPEGTEVEEKGTASIIDIKRDREKSEISFVSMLTVPEGCKMKMAGIIATSDIKVGTSGEGFNKDSASRVRGDAWTGNAYRYTWTVKTKLTYYVRPYLVYEDQNGNIITMYGTMVQGSPLDE